MSQEFVAKHGLLAKGDSQITGTLTVSQGITSSLGAFTTASWATNTVSASFASTVVTSSFATNAGTAATASSVNTASYANTFTRELTTGSTYPITASWAITASFAQSAVASIPSRLTVNDLTASLGITGSLTGSVFGTSSWAITSSFTQNSMFASASFVSDFALLAGQAISSSYTTTSSYLFPGTYQITSSAAVSASYSLSSSYSVSSSIASTASFSTSGSYSLSSSYSVSSSATISSSWAFQSYSSSAVGLTWDVQINSGSMFDTNDSAFGNFVSVPVTSSATSSIVLPIYQQVIAPGNQARATIKVNNQLFCGTSLQPTGTIYVVKTPDTDLTNIQSVSASFGLGNCNQVCYVSSSGLLYFIGNQNRILQVSASDITKQALFVNMSSSFGLLGGTAPSICTDGTFIYGVTSTTTSSFFKIQISNATLAQSQSWQSGSVFVSNGGAVVMDTSNTGSYYATTTVGLGYVARVSTSNLANYTASFLSGSNLTDDPVLLNGLLYTGGDSFLSNDNAFKVNTSSLAFTTFTIEPTYGLFSDGTHLYNTAGPNGYFVYYPNGDITQPYRFSIGTTHLTELWITDGGRFIAGELNNANIYQIGFGVNNVGMGTATPQYNLDVRGSFRADKIYGNITDTIGNFWKLNSANQIFNSNGTGSNVLIQTGSNLLIGPSATTTASLHISGSPGLNILQGYSYNNPNTAVFSVSPEGTASFINIRATGSFFGTASWAINSTSTSSFATSASYAVSSSVAATASFATTTKTASFATAFTASQGIRIGPSGGAADLYISASTTANVPLLQIDSLTQVGVFKIDATGSMFATGSLFGTSSWANNVITSSFSVSSSYAVSSSVAATASFSSISKTASFATAFTASQGIQIGPFSDASVFHISASTTANLPLIEVDSLTQDAVFKIDATGSMTATGSLFGTSSWANNAVSSSYSLSSSYSVSSSVAITASFAQSAVASIPSRLTVNDLTASLGITGSVTGSFTGSLIGSLTGTSSWASNSVSSSYSLSSSYAVSSSVAITASFAQSAVASIPSRLTVNDLTASLGITGSITGSFTGSLIGSLTGTSSWANNAISSSYSLSSSYSVNSSVAATASFATSASYAVSSSVASTASFSTSGSFASSFPKELTTGSTYPITSSWAISSITSSILVTANLSASVPSYAPGILFYDTASATFTYYNDDPNVMLNIGQETFIRVYNSGSTTANFISNGSAVYLSGSFNNTPTAWLAIADGTGNKFNVLGVATENIQTSSFGYVTVQGIVHNIPGGFNFASGSQLWLSTTVSGSYQTTVPTGTNEKVSVGFVLTSGSGGSNFLVSINEHAYGSTTASFAISASYAVSSSVAASSSFATTASFANSAVASIPSRLTVNDLTASLGITGSLTGSFFGTTSFAQTAVSCDFAVLAGTSTSSSYAITSSLAYTSRNLSTDNYQFERWDFLSPVTQSNQNILADGTWCINTGSIVSTDPTGIGFTNHPGIIIRRSTAVTNQINTFQIGLNSSSAFMQLGDVGQCKFIIQLLTGSYSQSIRIGLFKDPSQDPPQGFWFEKYQTGSGIISNTWWANAASPSAQNSASTGVNCTSSATWRNFTIVPINLTGTGSDFYIDGNLVAQVLRPNSLPVGTNMGIQVIPKNPVSYDVLIDYISLSSYPYNVLIR